MTKLFVGSLPYSTTVQELTDLFTPFGKVDSAVIINDRFSGQSKGFGFVEMSSDEEAQKAIQALNGSDYNGRNLVVSVARPREERPARDNQRGGYSDNRSGGGHGGFDRNRRGR